MDTTTKSLTAIALQKFKKNFWGVFSFWFIIALIFISVFAYIFTPDHSENANQMHLSIHSKSPGFEVQMLSIPLNEKVESKLSYYFFGFPNNTTEIPITAYKVQNEKLIYTEFSDDKALAQTKEIGLEKFLGFSSIKEVAEQNIKTQKFYLGTDKYGRDLLSRMIIGSRISLSIGFIAVFISLIVGIFFGALGGYFGGKVDAFVM